MWSKRCGASFLNDAWGATIGDVPSPKGGGVDLQCEDVPNAFAQKIQYILYIFKIWIVK